LRKYFVEHISLYAGIYPTQPGSTLTDRVITASLLKDLNRVYGALKHLQ